MINLVDGKLNVDHFYLREATAADLELVMSLEEHGFNREIRESREVMLRRIMVFPEGFLLFCNESNQSVGYFCSEIWRREVFVRRSSFEIGHDIQFSHIEDGDELYISSMTIDPVWRGLGLGAQLFRRALDRLRKRFDHLTSAVLLVHEQWVLARKIYASYGFLEIEKFEHFFRDGTTRMHDGIVMRKNLLESDCDR